MSAKVTKRRRAVWFLRWLSAARAVNRVFTLKFVRGSDQKLSASYVKDFGTEL